MAVGVWLHGWDFKDKIIEGVGPPPAYTQSSNNSQTDEYSFRPPFSNEAFCFDARM